MEEARQLISKRDSMEDELRRLKQILSQNNVSMNDPLVDKDGYPRDDIDIYAIRKTRHDIICLENDLRALMKEIEEALHNVHSSLGGVSVSSDGENQASSSMEWQKNSVANKNDAVAETESLSQSPIRTSNEVFLRAEDVSPSSPAAVAGLLSGDQVVQFGSLCASNFSNLQQVAEIVRNSVDAPLRITVVRDLHAVRLVLVPKQWTGQGLLGCRVVPSRRQ